MNDRMSRNRPNVPKLAFTTYSYSGLFHCLVYWFSFYWLFMGFDSAVDVVILMMFPTLFGEKSGFE